METVREDLQHLMDQYGSSPALLRIAGRPVYYMYDSYRIPADAWAKLLTPHGDLTVRGTDLDGGWCGVVVTCPVNLCHRWHRCSISATDFLAAGPRPCEHSVSDRGQHMHLSKLQPAFSSKLARASK